jgi:uncharacterized protein YraI
MSLVKTLAAATLALGLVAGTAGAASAATIAWADQNAAVKAKPQNGSATVNWLHNGQKVTVVGCFANNWCKVQVPGKDGFVKKTALNFGWKGPGKWHGNGGWNNGWNNGWNDHGPHGQACVAGPHGYFCIGG